MLLEERYECTTLVLSCECRDKYYFGILLLGSWAVSAHHYADAGVWLGGVYDTWSLVVVAFSFAVKELYTKVTN